MTFWGTRSPKVVDFRAHLETKIEQSLSLDIHTLYNFELRLRPSEWRIASRGDRHSDAIREEQNVPRIEGFGCCHGYLDGRPKLK